VQIIVVGRLLGVMGVREERNGGREEGRKGGMEERNGGGAARTASHAF
jgi:hypothetical protein